MVMFPKFLLEYNMDLELLVVSSVTVLVLSVIVLLFGTSKKLGD